jgi:hypothetical protein
MNNKHTPMSGWGFGLVVVLLALFLFSDGAESAIYFATAVYVIMHDSP